MRDSKTGYDPNNRPTERPDLTYEIWPFQFSWWENGRVEFHQIADELVIADVKEAAKQAFKAFARRSGLRIVRIISVPF